MKILIIKLSAIGDVIHTLPALNAIRKKYPDAHITWLVEEAASGLIKGHPAIDRILVSKRKQWIKDLSGLSCMNSIKEASGFIKKLRDTRYDLVIDFQGLLKSAILAGLSKGKCKAGFGRGMEHQEHSYLFLNKRISPVSMDNHALKRSLMLIDSMGIGCGDIVFNLPVTGHDKRLADDLLDNFLNNSLIGHEIKAPRLLFAVNPVAKWETKLWSNGKFAVLADRLIEQYNARVVFTGSAQDRKIIQSIISDMKQEAADLSGKTSLKVLAAIYERANCLVSTDTGPMHLAAAVGTPVVALFGPTAPWRTGPFGKGHKIIRAGLCCSPCFKRQCTAIDCMKQISVDDVLAGVNKLDLT